MRKQRGIKVSGKLTFILFVFIAILLFLSGRVCYLKTVHGEEYENRAKNQQISRNDKVVPPNRGSIVDRNNQVLAVSTAVYNVVFDVRNLFQMKTEVQESTLKLLTTTFPELDYDVLKKYLAKNEKTGKATLDTHWKYLVKGVDRETKEKLEAKEIQGVYFEQDTKRSYPLKTVACQLLGFLRGDAQWGIESQYDEYMSGVSGRSLITYDGGRTAVSVDYPAQDGDTMVTTIDYTIQQYAEEVVAETANEWECENVSALVMNPNTGEIYAMADSNNFDLNNPSEPLALSDNNFKSIWEAMKPEEQVEYLNKRWKNFGVSSTFEPGSIFKPIVAAAAVEENVISPNESFYCSGSKQVADRNIRCHLRSGHGAIDLQGVLAQSCNVGMMDIANKMGKDMFYQYQKDFGFGEKTGIDLPGEVSASNLMFTPERIGVTELATMSFGQGFNCTSIQILDAFSALINGGKLMRPYLVSQVINGDGDVVMEREPEVRRKVISQKTSDIIRNQLQATIEVGTGKKAAIGGYSIGGKTGTAQQGSRSTNDEWVLSFVSYFPVENPEYIVMTVINRPSHYGGEGVQSPSPMTKKLMERIIKYKNLEPSDIKKAEEGSKKDVTKVTLDEYTGNNLYSTIASLESVGLSYKVVGSGNTVTNQAPHGGTVLEADSQVILYVKKGTDESDTKPIPNVQGLSYTDAVTKLNDNGFEVVVEGEKVGLVSNQSPPYGISAKEGTEVVIHLNKKETEKKAEAE